MLNMFEADSSTRGERDMDIGDGTLLMPLQSILLKV